MINRPKTKNPKKTSNKPRKKRKSKLMSEATAESATIIVDASPIKIKPKLVNYVDNATLLTEMLIYKAQAAKHAKNPN
ncbi:hypothetical protein U2054_15650, partial [Listeria monocytogenes]|uniref:hypothetical protein n=1 Tax=Listeria monocytogenes TaxID=1639 RepID=UPI002FDC13DD